MAESRSNTPGAMYTENGQEIRSIHFIGIGGVGMSGIARVAHDQGLQVSGSDLRRSKYTDQLVEVGITVYIGQAAENVAHHPDIVVVSTAILENNPELQAAKAAGLEIWHRAKMLSFLGRGLNTLAVAGTHGKTTTSSMLATVLDEMGYDPTFLIGGIVRSYGTNAHSGAGEHYVVEADESDKSFTYLNPKAVIVTNVEADHLDHYKDLAEIRSKFLEFMGSVPSDGVVVACGDDPELVALAQKSPAHLVTYGFSESCDVRLTLFEPQGVGSAFAITLPDGRVMKSAVVQNPGRHNALNAAAVLTLIYALGFSAEKAAACMAQFRGVRRRFDLVGAAAGVTIVDDYAHHPTEIAATISAAKTLDFQRVVVLFQPHRYSRVTLFTEVLREEFSHAFDQCDELVFMDVYSAGEAPVPGVSGKTFLAPVLDQPNHPHAEFVKQRLAVIPRLLQIVQPGDLVITMGAGDVTAMGPELLEALSGTES